MKDKMKGLDKRKNAGFDIKTQKYAILSPKCIEKGTMRTSCPKII